VPVDARVEADWDTLEAWWEAQLGPDFKSCLRPGASETELDALESLVGAPLPADFRAAYRRHDGQSEFYQQGDDELLLPGIFFGLPMMPLARIASQLKELRALIAEMVADGSLESLNEDQGSVPEGQVQPVFMHPMWIPFADDSAGNFLGIDLAPDVEGLPGQVINFGDEEDVNVVIAPSFGAYLHHVAGELSRGNFKLVEESPGEWSLNIGKPEGTTHYLDAVRMLYGEDED
jgi:cell wall assembly regulator SMI1